MCTRATNGEGRMEVAILRARASILCEGDFGLARVVIGYTYQWLFLPLPTFAPNPHWPPSLPPTKLLGFASVQPLNMITFAT